MPKGPPDAWGLVFLAAAFFLLLFSLSIERTKLVSFPMAAEEGPGPEEWDLRLDDGTHVPRDLELGLFCESGSCLHLVRRHGPAHDAAPMAADGPAVDWIRLNVGGKYLVTSRTTLCGDPNSMLAKMFGQWPASHTDATGAYMLDLDARYFEPILNYLRWGVLALDPGVSPEGVRATAKFLQIGESQSAFSL